MNGQPLSNADGRLPIDWPVDDAGVRSGLEERYGQQLVGKLACLDRMIIYGTLQGLCHPGAVVGELQRLNLGIFELKEFVLPLTAAVRARAEELAREAGVPIEFLRDWRSDKEDLAKERLQRRGYQPGLVCVLSAMENCQTFEPRKGGGVKKQPWLKPTGGRCLHYYFYFYDEDLGLIHLRVPTWIPFRLQFHLNGHSWLERRLRAAGLDCQCEDNAVVAVSNWAQAQALSSQPPMAALEERLQHYVARCCPQAARFGGYYLTLAQVELSLDLVFQEEPLVSELGAELTRQAMLIARAGEVARFFGHEFSPEAEATTRFGTVREGVLRVRHFLGDQSIKLYNKGVVLRIEVTTHDVRFFKHHREVKKRDGTSQWKVAPLKKSLFSLGTLQGLLEAACQRYLCWLSRLEDPRIGRHNLDQITRPKRDEKQRSWRGFNFFAAADQQLLLAVLGGEATISGWTNRRLRAVLAGHYNSSQVGRLLRRLREHGLIHRIAHTCKYYLTKLGYCALIAARKLQEHLIIPTLNVAT
jgi:hypothetical protein